MKTKAFRFMAAILGLVALTTAGCDRKSRGNPADERYRAATPAEGGATSTQGSAGDPKNFGDTRTKTEQEGKSPSASPTGLSKDAKATDQTQTPAAGPSTGPAPSPTK